MKVDKDLYDKLLSAMWRAYHGQDRWPAHSTEYYTGKNTLTCSVCLGSVDIAFAVLTSEDQP